MKKVHNIVISARAINEASLNVLYEWSTTREESEGIHAWLDRMVEELQEKEPLPENDLLADKKLTKVVYEEIEFLFEFRVWGGVVLKSVKKSED